MRRYPLTRGDDSTRRAHQNAADWFFATTGAGDGAWERIEAPARRESRWQPLLPASYRHRASPRPYRARSSRTRS
jgi:hypothetical protein